MLNWNPEQVDMRRRIPLPPLGEVFEPCFDPPPTVPTSAYYRPIHRLRKKHRIQAPLSAQDIDDNFDAVVAKMNEVIAVVNGITRDQANP